MYKFLLDFLFNLIIDKNIFKKKESKLKYSIKVELYIIQFIIWLSEERINQKELSKNLPRNHFVNFTKDSHIYKWKFQNVKEKNK